MDSSGIVSLFRSGGKHHIMHTFHSGKKMAPGFQLGHLELSQSLLEQMLLDYDHGPHGSVLGKHSALVETHICSYQRAGITFSQLFSDALREVQKYSGPEPMQDAIVNPNVFDHVHMKLFRGQRNLYISGFSLFLWLIMRRLVTLLNQAAVSEEKSAALQATMDNMANEARQHEEEHKMLRQTLFDDEKTMTTKISS
uniref:Endoplasmic reticulum transmembrane protein n=1 Tax=Neogobius melanostomus TaxID=47308 RepID=A0A8C6WW68_9GOBI